VASPSLTGCAAAAWALAFAGLSFYWAAGGRLGLGTLALALRDKTLAREQGFVALLWFTGALKVLVALLAIALVRRRGTVLPRRVLLGAGWATGVALARYGALGPSSTVVSPKWVQYSPPTPMPPAGTSCFGVRSGFSEVC